MKILIFYTSFYTFLFSFWLFMLLIFLQTISDDRPNWANEESLLKMNPGLSFRPRIPFDKADNSIIIFNLNDSNSYLNWVNDLNSFLKPYGMKRSELNECARSGLRDSNCPFLPDFHQQENPCGAPDFGYSIGQPCFLIKLNRVIFVLFLFKNAFFYLYFEQILLRSY